MKATSLQFIIFLNLILFTSLQSQAKPDKINFLGTFSEEQNLAEKTSGPDSFGEHVTFKGMVGPEYGRIGSIAFDPVNENVAYASGMDGRFVFKSSDNGLTWEFFYSTPQVPNWGSVLRNFRFANPDKPNHLYFTVTSGSEQDTDVRGLYVLDVNTGELVNLIQLSHIHYQNFRDYDVCQNNPEKIIFFTMMPESPVYDGSRRMVWLTEDEGETFEMIYDWEENDMHAPVTVNFDPENSQTILLGMGGGWYDVEGGFLRSTDNGTNWTHYEAGNIIGDVAFHPEDPNKVYAVTGFGADEDMVMMSSDGGKNWIDLECEFTSSASFNSFVRIAIDPESPENIWVTSHDEIFNSSDGGQTWESTLFEQNDYNTYFYGSVISFNPYNPQNVIIGSDKRIVQTHNYGESWELVDNPFLNINSIDATLYPNNEAYLYYTSQGSYFVHCLESDTVYGEVGLDMVGEYYFIFGDHQTQNRAFMGVPGGFFGGISIYQSDDNFSTEGIEVYHDNEAGLLSEIIRDPDDENTYWFTTPLSDLFGPVKLVRTNDDFASTEELSITGEPMELITSIEVVETQPGVIWAYATGMENSGIFKSEDYGDTWSSYSNGLPEEVGVWDIAVNPNNPDNIVAMVSDEHGIYTSFNGGENWSNTFSEFECAEVVFSKEHEDVVFARRFVHSGLLYSEDGGQNWYSVTPEEFIDVTYTGLDIIENEDKINIYMSGIGTSILHYTYFNPGTYSLTYHIENEEGDEILDATITLDGVDYEAGVYVFEDLEPGTYPYIVNRDGYQAVEDEVTIEDTDVVVNVTLQEEEVPVFTVTFHIQDEEGEDITEAKITFDGTQYGPGVYVFEEIEAGTYDYLLTKEGYHEKTGEVSVTDEDVEVEIILERDDVSLTDPHLVEFSVFPNPASTELNIRSEEKIKEIRIFDMLGQQVYSEKVQNTNHQLDVTNLDYGIYFLKINTLKGFATEKIQIIK